LKNLAFAFRAAYIRQRAIIAGTTQSIREAAGG
jgi:hypothetical protein